MTALLMGGRGKEDLMMSVYHLLILAYVDGEQGGGGQGGDKTLYLLRKVP